MNKVIIFIMVALTVYVSSVWADDVLKIMYHDRPPYMVFDSEDMISGLVGFPVHKAVKSSGIKHVWVNIPPKRQLKYIQENREKVCGVGWFKNFEREQYAKFTSPVYKDTVTIGFALSNNSKIQESSCLKEVFQNKDLTLLVKQGYSYGTFIDEMIKTYNPKRNAVSVDNEKALKMLNHNRADYLFMTIEEAYDLTIGNGLKMSDYKIIYFRNLSERNMRYIMCSERVEDSEIYRLNQWIDAYVNIQ